MFPLFVLTSIAIVLLIRSLMILIGIYKEPILRTFEEYGPDENVYLPGLGILLWGSFVIIFAGIWASQIRGLSTSLQCLGALMLMGGIAAYHYIEVIRKYHLRFLKFPRWYHELRERTTRYERRRMAYMWLHLPLRLRLTYNSSDKQFLIWADFVILGTIREEQPSAEEQAFLDRVHQ